MMQQSVIGLAPQTRETSANLIVGKKCVDVMRTWSEGIIPLAVTSPPYDSLRVYQGYDFPFEEIATELYRITAPGGSWCGS